MTTFTFNGQIGQIDTDGYITFGGIGFWFCHAHKALKAAIAAARGEQQ
jgi:hypothetical protein